MAYRREQYGTLLDRLGEPPRTLTFVTGPANVADLAALTAENLERMAKHIRTGSTAAEGENLCRDPPLSDLQILLKAGGGSSRTGRRLRE